MDLQTEYKNITGEIGFPQAGVFVKSSLSDSVILAFNRALEASIDSLKHDSNAQKILESVGITLPSSVFNQAVQNSNIEFVRNKKANKQAQKRLKMAQKLLNEGKKDQFYEEVLKAVWSYLSDKLAIPAASLTKERVEAELSLKGVNADAIKQFTDILNTCEFARYAPNSGQQEMGNLYAEAIDAISNLEDIIKKS